MTMDKFLEGKRRLEKLNNKECNTRVLEGTFEEKHKRVTLYLENPLFEQIQELRMGGEIPNMTRFINKVLKSYLKEKEL